MPKSKNRPAYAAKKKQTNIKKQKAREMSNDLQKQAANMPVSYTYHKDAESVQIPMKAWQMMNALAKELQPLAMLVSTFEQIGQDHIANGTLIPVFQGDIEPEMQDGAPKIVSGQIQYKLKDEFWEPKVQLVNSDGSKLGEVHTLEARD
jgi:hypothetical protein